MVLNKSKKGAQGIGTLIIFIAMILVAAVAAGVLIQTASSLQSKALDVGTQSQERVTTTLDVVQVYGMDASDHALNGTVDSIYVVVRLGSGSSPIKVTDLRVKVDTKSTSGILDYNASGSSTTQFTVSGLSGSDYIETGDTAILTFNCTTDILESQRMTVTLMPKTGSPVPVEFTTPSVMVDKVVPLR